ncbi:MAG: hypothetical protein HBSAPP03_22900 [Phycisphaerae bacterium]|nr:MAG: hypothetical protein HBSAPP03_22900 [Phycisphaerae bacterium]
MTTLRFNPNAVSAVEHPAEEFDALADLFLGGESSPPVATATDEGRSSSPSALPTPGAPEIEGLILGHLPVFGSAWVTQYAKSVAERERVPVALLRVSNGETWLDLVLPRGLNAPVRSRIGGGQEGALAGAIAQAAAQTSRWMLRVDDTSEADLATSDGLTRVTLLTGADDPAVVASYRTIKNLASAAGESCPPVRLAVMGVDVATASAASEKVAKTVSLFLSHPLDVAPAVDKIGSCTTISLHRSKTSPTPAELFAMIRATIPHATGARAFSSEQSPAVAPTAPPQADHAETSAREACSTPDLSAVLSGLGLRPLSSSCPVAPRVQMAVSHDGVLHMLSFANGESPERGLLGAASWADQHAELLRAAFPVLSREGGGIEPTLHLITTRAKSCRALLDTGVRVHLAVLVNGVWALHDLN